jgi:SAM-dependent methyltransferase
MTVDFGKAAPDFRFRAGYPSQLLDRLAPYGIDLPGQRVLDVGTGAGAMARMFARKGCRVTGLDKSYDLTDEAIQLDHDAGVDIPYIVRPVEDSGLLSTSWDGITAAQCWTWFDRPRAAREVHRLLVPGGWLLIVHFDWLPLGGNIVEATEQLILRYNTELLDWKVFGQGTGLYPLWLPDLAEVGFGSIETFSFDVMVPYTHANWRRRVRATPFIGPALPEDRIRAFVVELDDLLHHRFAVDPLQVPHRVFAIVCRKGQQ